MHYFNNDYMAGGHPEVMKALADTNLLHTVGYGLDGFCGEARELILDRCGLRRGEVFFFEGGTQTNATVIDGLLGKLDGVLCADTAHINVHEAGAIEASGHKVISLPGHLGKLRATDVEEYMEMLLSDDTREHIMVPGMVYVSFPTELGTLYTREELTELHDVCLHYELPLYIDGARLAYGLQGEGNDLDLRDIASLCEAFYIGGTKCGALFGEAMVTGRPELFPRFRTLIKQHGALLAKGRLLGVQFSALMRDDLYDRIGRNGVGLALRIKQGMKERGVPLLIDSPTNQQFFIMPNSVIDRLREEVSFENWGAPGREKSAVRFVTDWSTTSEDVDSLFRILDSIL